MFACIFGSLMMYTLWQVVLDINDEPSGMAHKAVQAFIDAQEGP